jgi:hypothetical protein
MALNWQKWHHINAVTTMEKRPMSNGFIHVKIFRCTLLDNQNTESGVIQRFIENCNIGILHLKFHVEFNGGEHHSIIRLKLSS